MSAPDKHDLTFLCQQDELAHGQCRGFNLAGAEQWAREIFLVCRLEQVYGYENRCPHTGVNLNWLPDQFLDIDGRLIQCSVHGALFRIEDGRCIRGPCLGQSLQPVTLVFRDGCIYLGD